MSNDLDQFTINYKIQVNAAIQNLAKLNDQVATTNKAANAGEKAVGAFGEAITSNLGGALPTLNKLSSVLKSITAEFGLVSAGAALAGGAIYNAMRVRDQFNAQRTQSPDAGVSAVRLEDWQRRMASGNVSRDSIARAVTGSQSFLRGAYADPSRIGPANRLLGMLGINPAAGGAPITNTDFLTRLATRWHGQSDSTVEAEAQMVGMDKDVALKMKELGASIGEIGMSLKDMRAYLDVAKNVHTLNDELARFNEQITQLGEKFAGPVLTSVTTLLKMINDAKLPTTDAGAASSLNHQLTAGEDATSGIAAAYVNDKAEREAAANTDREASRDLWKKQEHQYQEQQAQAAAEQRQKQELAAQEEKGNADFQGSVSQMELIINAFGASVSQFGHTLSTQQVRAAWAGAAGLAGGISESGHKQLGYGESPGSINFDSNAANAMYNYGAASSGQYDSIIKQASAKTGVPENIIRGIIGAESTWNPSAHSDSSFGLMGVNRVNWKAYGMNETNWNDPTANIGAGTAIYAAMLKKANGDQNLALRYYNGGFNRSKWGPQNAAYPDKVLGGTTLTGPRAIAMDPNYKGPWRFSGPTALAAGLGESFESSQLKDLQATIAARAGVSLGQLQTRNAFWGDVNFAGQNYMSELVNSRFAIKQGLGAAGLTDMQRGQLMGNLKTVDLQILNMSRYMPQILANTQEGGRANTTGQTPTQVVIKIEGTELLKIVKSEINGALGNALGSVANSRTTAVKR
ncbi:transglycosylase SLT domain-containing protein [Paraburkholderia phymatum]|uniref:Transglycosylase SLT domain-containing protein n=1 Tax=Paraburkholderia phymatum TaxID=148447 RepID=A0ACC6U0N8_9BURK